jgi:hypothetical protein
LKQQKVVHQENLKYVYQVCVNKKNYVLFLFDKFFFLDGLSLETRELIMKNDDESIEPVRVILKFRKYLFQSDVNLNETN